MMNSLRSKIFVFVIALMMIVMGTMLTTVFFAVKKQEQQQVQTQLQSFDAVIKRHNDTRNYYLSAFAETVAKDFGLKSAFSEDLRSFLVALNNHRKRIDADFAIAVDTEKSIVSELLIEMVDGKPKVRRGPESGTTFRFPEWLANTDIDYFYFLNGKIYQLRLESLRSGRQIVGWIGFGYEINAALAERYAELTGLNTTFMLDGPDGWSQVAAYSFDGTIDDQSHMQTVKDLLDDPDRHKKLHIVKPIGDIATLSNIDEKYSLTLIMYSNRDYIAAALQKRWLQLAAIGGVMLLIAVIGAFFISRGITRPIKRLVEHARNITRGNYGEAILVGNDSEVAALASEFNTMQDAIVQREQQIRHSLYHASLTDLPNRKSLEITIDEWIANGKSAFPIFLINIRGMSDINDTLGFNVGNQVIQEMARRLLQLRFEPKVFHVGGDEFVLLVDPDHESDMPICSQTVDDEVCRLLLEEVNRALQPNFHCEEMDLHLRIGAGITVYPTHGDTSATLLQKADAAMRQARRNKVWVQIYDAAQDVNTVERLSLINDLRQAIRQDQLTLFYQPKLTINKGEIHHVEALVRWIHPKHGMVRPDEFIHLAEQTGQINDLTEWVLNEAARQHKAWADQGLYQQIAVNISAENLKIPNFTGVVQSILQKHDVDVAAIALEVTESAVVDDPEFAIGILEELKSLGFKLSIDDYGTGYSSLAQLKQLPVHELKIDKSFVLQLTENKGDQVIVQSTIELAHNMGLTVVAEGIEDLAALEWLGEANCELAQGYYIQRPQPATDYYDWLQSSDFFPNQSATA